MAEAVQWVEVGTVDTEVSKQSNVGRDETMVGLSKVVVSHNSSVYPPTQTVSQSTEAQAAIDWSPRLQGCTEKS